LPNFACGRCFFFRVEFPALKEPYDPVPFITCTFPFRGRRDLFSRPGPPVSPRLTVTKLYIILCEVPLQFFLACWRPWTVFLAEVTPFSFQCCYFPPLRIGLKSLRQSLSSPWMRFFVIPDDVPSRPRPWLRISNVVLKIGWHPCPLLTSHPFSPLLPATVDSTFLFSSCGSPFPLDSISYAPATVLFFQLFFCRVHILPLSAPPRFAAFIGPSRSSCIFPRLFGFFVTDPPSPPVTQATTIGIIENFSFVLSTFDFTVNRGLPCPPFTTP